jgi:hypothetical protein
VSDRLFHRWFIQYNPLYFTSALCVLVGAFLLTRDPADWDNGQIALAGVIQLYELALIAGGAFLFNLPGQRRPAVILGITAIAFLFDVTFRNEGLASVGPHTLNAGIAWAVLAALKLTLLAHALRVRVPVAHWAAWVLGALAIALVPQMLAARAFDPAHVLIGACWLGLALAALAVWGMPDVRCEVTLDEWGRTVLNRAVRAAPLIWTGLYWTHVVTWCGIYELTLHPVCFAPVIVLLPIIVRKEVSAWILSVIVLAIGARWPAAFAYVAALLALGLAIKGYRARWPRLHVAAVLAAYLASAAYLAGELQIVPPPLWLALGAAAVLPALAWRYRLGSTLAGAVLCAAPGFVPFLPVTEGQWGVSLLGTGFAALAVGIAFNWWSSREPRRFAHTG